MPPVLAGPYDVVASTCLLSPLIGNAFHSIGESHPQFMAMVQAIRMATCGSWPNWRHREGP